MRNLNKIAKLTPILPCGGAPEPPDLDNELVSQRCYAGSESPSSLLKETEISLAELARQRGVAPSTVYRWVSRGIRGIRLKSYRLGGKQYTTKEALQRWVAATSEGDFGPRDLLNSHVSSTAVRIAERRLREEGVWDGSISAHHQAAATQSQFPSGTSSTTLP